MKPDRFWLGLLLRLHPTQLHAAIRVLLDSPAAQQLTQRLRNALLTVLHEEAVDRLRALLRHLKTSGDRPTRRR